MKTLTVTRLGAVTGARDAQGNVVRAPNTTSSIVVRAVAPNVADETVQDSGARIITGYRVYGYPGLTLLPTDRLTIDGVPGWHVEGDVGRWESAFGSSLGGVEFVVRRSS